VNLTADAKKGVNAWNADGSMHLFLLEMEENVSKALSRALLTEGKLLAHLEVLTGFLLLRQSGFAAQLITHIL